MAKKISKAISTIVIIIMLILAVLLIGVRIFGYTPYSVLSPSMTPKYPVGALVYIHEIEPKDIVVGDDITFVFDESLLVVTHQVVEIDENHEYFTTKGLANDSNDGNPVYYPNILGKVYFSIPYLGYVSDVVTSPIGLIISVGLILIWIIIIYMVNQAKKNKEISQKANEEIIQE